MTRNRLFFFMLVSFFVGIIAWTSYAMIGGEQEAKPYQVSVIVNDSNNDRWIALRQGLEQAAKDYHMDLNYVSTGKFKNSEEERALIRRELESGAQGIIVQGISDETETFDPTEFLSHVAVVLLESDGGSGDSCAVVGADNEAIGKAMGEAVIRDYGDSLAGKRIGILSGGGNGSAMRQRQQGLTQTLQKKDAVIVRNIFQIDGGPAQKKEQTAWTDSADIVIALDNDGTEWMIDVIQAGVDEGSNCALYGVGGSEKAVYYLDKGVVKTLVVPNEFKMGYQSMEAIANQLQHHTRQKEDYQVDYLVINQENMYDKKNQKLLFPIVQ